MICKPYAKTYRHQFLCALTNIKMPEFGKINVFLARSPDNSELSAIYLGFCETAKVKAHSF